MWTVAISATGSALVGARYLERDDVVRVMLAHPSKHSRMGMGFLRMKAGAVLVKSLRVVIRILS
jgi:hypothetical protein